MSLKTDEINSVIERVQKQLSSYNSALELICITHKTDGRKQACMSLRKGYMGEEVSISLNRLLSAWTKDNIDDSQSEFLGTIETYRSGFGGLIKKKLYLNIIALNTGLYDTEEEMELDLYRLSWNACNALKNMMENSGKDGRDRILVPNPKGIRLLSNNLQSDIFASLLYSLIYREDYVEKLGRNRAKAVIDSSSKFEPDLFPFIMTLDQTKYMCNQLLNKRKLNSNPVEQVWAASKIILQTMNQKKLEVWQRFAKYSQDMAWRGFSSEVILSIAIDRNDDIETKKLGVQVASLTDTKPVSADESVGYYNPYKTDVENAEIHLSLIDELFENLLTRAIFENSAKPLFEKADEQNMKLRKSQFMGWCASALQEAGDVFDRSIRAKQPPTQTTREIFKQGLQKMPWMRLKDLGEEILKLRREKKDVSDRDFIEFLERGYNYRIVANSVLRTFEKNKPQMEKNISTLEDTMAEATDEIYGPKGQTMAYSSARH